MHGQLNCFEALIVDGLTVEVQLDISLFQIHIEHDLRCVGSRRWQRAKIDEIDGSRALFERQVFVEDIAGQLLPV